jgi:hypothetical protein
MLINMEEATNTRRGDRLIAPKLADWNRIAARQKIAPFGTISFGRLRGLAVHLKTDMEKASAVRIFPSTVNRHISNDTN